MGWALCTTFVGTSIHDPHHNLFEKYNFFEKLAKSTPFYNLYFFIDDIIYFIDHFCSIIFYNDKKYLFTVLMNTFRLIYIT